MNQLHDYDFKKNCYDFLINEDKTYIINDFYNMKNFNVFNYKIAMLWMPILLYIFILLFIISYIPVVNIYNFNSSFHSEKILSIYSFIVMLIVYTFIDYIYQINICNKNNKFKLFKNSLYNAFYISIFTTSGYIIAMNFENYNISNSQNISVINIVNHMNNLVWAVIFYYLTMIIINPIVLSKDRIYSRNKLC